MPVHTETTLRKRLEIKTAMHVNIVNNSLFTKTTLKPLPLNIKVHHNSTLRSDIVIAFPGNHIDVITIMTIAHHLIYSSGGIWVCMKTGGALLQTWATTINRFSTRSLFEIKSTPLPGGYTGKLIRFAQSVNTSDNLEISKILNDFSPIHFDDY